MKKLTDFFKQKAENGNNNNLDLFKFKSPKGNETTVFKVKIVPNIVDGKPKNEELFFIENRKHRGFYNKAAKRNDLNLTCPKMFGEDCPICNNLGDIWNKGKKDLYRELKVRKNYIVNVYVIENPSFPESEGKIQRMYLSQEVFETLITEMTDDDDPKNFINFSKGNIIKFTIKQKDNGFNGWSVKLLKGFDLGKTDINWNEITSLDDIMSKLNEKTPSFNKILDILQNVSSRNFGQPESTSQSKPIEQSVNSAMETDSQDYMDQIDDI